MWIPGDLPHRRRRRLPALHARLPLLQVGGRLRRRTRGRGPRRRHTRLWVVYPIIVSIQVTSGTVISYLLYSFTPQLEISLPAIRTKQATLVFSINVRFVFLLRVEGAMSRGGWPWTMNPSGQNVKMNMQSWHGEILTQHLTLIFLNLSQFLRKHRTTYTQVLEYKKFSHLGNSTSLIETRPAALE